MFSSLMTEVRGLFRLTLHLKKVVVRVRSLGQPTQQRERVSCTGLSILVTTSAT
jgi:hypothetical protein